MKVFIVLKNKYGVVAVYKYVLKSAYADCFIAFEKLFAAVNFETGIRVFFAIFYRFAK